MHGSWLSLRDYIRLNSEVEVCFMGGLRERLLRLRNSEAISAKL